eukprot:6202184-Pleurochrysis_carterae.AAC.1
MLFHPQEYLDAAVRIQSVARRRAVFRWWRSIQLEFTRMVSEVEGEHAAAWLQWDGFARLPQYAPPGTAKRAGKLPAQGASVARGGVAAADGRACAVVGAVAMERTAVGAL